MASMRFAPDVLFAIATKGTVVGELLVSFAGRGGLDTHRSNPNSHQHKKRATIVA
jgi:hypothetical protein